MLASVGRAVKYRPTDTVDFFRTASTLLDRHPHAHVYIVGPTAAQAARLSPFGSHPRLHALGPTVDPADVQLAADIYIESFPFGSQTACLEACVHGVPPVLAIAPACRLVATSDDAIDPLCGNPASEAEHLDQVEALIADPARRRSLGEELRHRVLEMHTGEGWLRQLEACYEVADGAHHSPSDIVERVPSRDSMHAALSAWHEAQRSYPLSADPKQLLAETINDFAYALREAGCYREAILLMRSHRAPARLAFATQAAIIRTAVQWASRGRA